MAKNGNRNGMAFAKGAAMIAVPALAFAYVSDKGAAKYAETHPEVDEYKQGAARVVVGAVVGVMLRKSMPKVALGVAIGGIAGGGLQIVREYEVRAAANAAANASAAANGNTPASLPAGTQGAANAYRAAANANVRRVSF